jgi:hypothetical protein
MRFSAADYGDEIAAVLALDGNGYKLMPLVFDACSSDEARSRVPALKLPDAAKSGLFVYLSCFDEAHEIAQSLASSEGAFWHGILHRREPDAANAEYWFRKTGKHPVFAAVLNAARGIAERSPGAEIGFSGEWDPIRFIEICESARRAPESALERAAREIQLAEWQLLFDYCARRGQ